MTIKIDGEIGRTYDPELGFLDITGSKAVQVQIKSDGSVLWVNAGGRCVLRICRIEGEIDLAISDSLLRRLQTNDG